MQNKQSVQEKKHRSHIKENSNIITAYFSMETLETRTTQSNEFQVLKDCDGQPRIIYPEKLFAMIGGERKNVKITNQP